MKARHAGDIPALLVFTDLDGTLLDHGHYGFEAARPALTRLADLHIPLIPATSKTLAEMLELQKALDNPHPCIVENGGGIAVPDGYFPGLEAQPLRDGYHILAQSADYPSIRAVLEDLRNAGGYRFRGFGDMSDVEVARDTGLDPASAARARRRLNTEPLAWRDSDEARSAFGADLARHGLQLVRGGRYWHVSGPRDKAMAMTELRGLYQCQARQAITTVALGDSPNDSAMLQNADIAVVIRRHDGSAMRLEDHPDIRTSEAIGPKGWNQALQSILDRFEGRAPGRPDKTH